MSTFATTTSLTESAVASKEAMEDTMCDSGVSMGSSLKSPERSLRLTAPEATVKMPSSGEAKLHDSGICSDLMHLSLTPEASKAWQEYFDPDEDGDTQLHLAIASGLADVVDALVRLAPTPEYLSIQNSQSYAPLHIAVLQNQPVLVRRLIVAGARPDPRDYEGNTPLHLAARRGYVDCAEALVRPISVLEAGQPQRVPVDLMDQRNSHGEHAVHLATMGGHGQFLQFLSWNGADVNALEGRAGRSALHLAVGARNLGLVRSLVEPRPQGCGICTGLIDWYGRTAFHLARINRQAEISNYLVAYVSASEAAYADQESSEAESDDEGRIIEQHLQQRLLNSSA